MNRVAITGLGVVSALGNRPDEVLESLRESRSGMTFVPEMRDLGYKCCVFAPVREIDASLLPAGMPGTMAAVSRYAAVAARQAMDDAGLTAGDLEAERTGVIIGTGAGGVREVPWAEDAVRAGLDVAPDPQVFLRIMNATAAASVAAWLGVRGRVCSLSAACATGLYNIGHAYELVKFGVQDTCLCGSAEEELWKYVGLSADNGGGLPSDYNDRPQQACRPYDRDRQGLIMSAGSGILILENLQRACKRGARIYAEVVGYGAANDGDDMFVPTGGGLKRAVQEAMQAACQSGVERIDYVNPHGAGTPEGDPVEVAVIKELFGHGPRVSSTKGISGHAQGGTASQEAVYTALMLHHNFVAPTVNLDHVAPECAGVRHVRSLEEGPLRTAVTFNSGLGGVNACLVLAKV